jgi:pimeloyl-ACP methyl ester carboxylesterase
MNDGVRLLPALALILALAPSAGCVPRVPEDPSLLAIERGRLPPPTVALTIPQLGPCTDDPDRTLHLDAGEPVVVVVHGCLGSAGLLRALAQVLAFHGQQAICFSYDDRDSLMVSSRELITAIEDLTGRLASKRMTVIGHSQGGLVARKALVEDRPDLLKTADAELRLVTLSAPFSGIASAQPCGSARAGTWSLGLVPAICRLISGDKWHEITYASDFIRRPGRLLPQVDEHLGIVTDERGTCRRHAANGTCAEDDFVFSLDEQRLPGTDDHPRMKIVEVKAGHVEIVGDRRAIPTKLIALLQEHGVLEPTEPGRVEAFERLLARLYLEAPGRRARSIAPQMP